MWIDGTRSALGALGLALLVACGGSDDGGGTTPPPPVVGKRVVFTANTSDQSLPNALWVTDTSGTVNTPTQVAHFPGTTVRLDQPFVSPGGIYFGARRAAFGNTVTGCPASMHIFTAATFALNTDYPLGGNACLHELSFALSGTNFAMRFSFDGATGPNLAAQATSHFPNTVFTIDTNALLQTGGTVQQYRWSIDGGFIAWTEAGGLYSSIGSGPGGTAHLRSADLPATFELGQIAGVAYAVYVAPGETRFRVANLNPGAPLSESYLTNALAGGDTLGAWTLSPDGAHLLYEVQVSGVWQLWLVSLAGPLAEQRVDASAPLIASSLDNTAGASKVVFAFNTDSTRFAWSGDVGAGSVRLNTATVAAPTVATVLTPSNEAPYQHLFWSDPNTIVYGEWGFGLPGPHSSIPGLRTVSVGAPLATAALYSGSVPNSNTLLGSIDICSDGTVVYQTHNLIFNTGGGSWPFNGLFAVHPSNPGGLHAITPWYGNLGIGMTGIGQFDCE